LPPDFIAFVMVVLLVLQFGLRYVLTYRLTHTDVRAVLLGVVPVSIRRYQSIREVQTISPLESLFTLAWRVHNKIMGQGVMVFSSQNASTPTGA
jgi:hypothetical protein